MAKIIDNTNLGYLISKIKSAFWPKTDVIPIGLDVTPTNNSSNLVTSGGVYSALENKYEKPSTGIPATDLASAVQTSLGKADMNNGSISSLIFGLPLKDMIVIFIYSMFYI